MTGILYETGCGKYIKLVEDSARFHSSKEDATVITKDQFDDPNIRQELFIRHRIHRYTDTIKFVELRKGEF